MTELHHFHPARKGSGSLCPFPIYPLYTRTVILSLDKPIADCFLFRPRKSCERRRKHSHTNVSNASVIRTSRVSQTPLQTPIPYFHQWVPHGKKALVAIACKTAHVRFHRRKRVHTRLSEKDRTQGLTRRNRGRFRWGVVSLPSERSTRFGNPAWPGIRTANFAALGTWSRVLSKNAESLRNSDALMRVAVPKASRPRWAA